MKYRPLFFTVLSIVVLMFASCEKVRPTMAYVSGDDSQKRAETVPVHDTHLHGERAHRRISALHHQRDG